MPYKYLLSLLSNNAPTEVALLPHEAQTRTPTKSTECMLSTDKLSNSIKEANVQAPSFTLLDFSVNHIMQFKQLYT